MKKIFFSVILLSVILLSFSGCVEKTPQVTESSAPETTPEITPEPETTPNNSSQVNVEGIEIYENVYEYINDTFSYNNRTYWAFYGDMQLLDSSYPKERVFLIKILTKYLRKELITLLSITNPKYMFYIPSRLIIIVNLL